MKMKLANNASEIELSDIFTLDYNEPLVHQVLTAYQAGARQGTKSQKNRSAVKATNAKPWKQKGTGRARAGDSKSPIWKGGGVTFAQRGVRDYSQKVNKKMYRKAIVSIISELIRQERLLIVDDLTMQQPKTKELASKLQELGLRKTLLVTEHPELDLYLAARNMPNVYVCEQAAIDPYSLIGVDKVCITVAALKQLEERLS